MHLTLHLTSACSMRCGYCYAPPNPGRRMSEETAHRALELGARMSGGSCGIVFFGGEPLLERDLIRSSVAFARDKEKRGEGRWHFKITTNGMLLDEEFLQFANREGILITMSLDGTRAAHDRHRRLPDGAPSHDLLVRRLRLLLRYKPCASVIMVTNPDTAGHVAESVVFLLDQGVRYIVHALNYAGAWREEDLEVLHAEYEKLAELYVAWTAAGRKFYYSPFETKLSSHINCERFRDERCDFARRQLSVDPDGHLYPCVQFPKAGPESRWRMGDVSTGVDAAAQQRLREEWLCEHEPCRRCALESRCFHTCACLNWQATGGIATVCPVLCRHERMLAPIVDRVGEELYRRREPLFMRKHYSTAYPLVSLLEDCLAGLSEAGNREVAASTERTRPLA
jgi:uncharacterized protein